jgi:hypothetical protein
LAAFRFGAVVGEAGKEAVAAASAAGDFFADADLVGTSNATPCLIFRAHNEALAPGNVRRAWQAA